MFLRTLAAALVAMCSLLASQTTPPSGSQAPNSANPLPTSLFPTPLVHLSSYPLTNGK